jgi:N-acetylglucosaminyldiphosphoundecaprenol N-acetyl-beta-D-mannosaminyltransferase
VAGELVPGFNLLGVRVAVTDVEEACATIASWVRDGRREYVCVAPVSTIVDCQRDQTYRHIVNSAGMTTPDGMPLVWLGRIAGHSRIARTYGPDVMSALCQLSEESGFTHYFFGGTQDSNRLLVEKVRSRFPRLRIVGSVAPPFRESGQHEDPTIIDRLNQADPDVLWVGLGSPKQDYWMHNHRDRLNARVMIGVGAAFDFLAGTKKQAPSWMRNTGLEWLFRLSSEPRRLWKRYLIGNAAFVGYLARDLLKRSRT